MKALYQAADGASAMAWAGDAGLLKIYERWHFGLSASNFGSHMKLGSTAFNLPLTLRAGVSSAVTERILISADAVKAGESGAAGAFGAEAELPSGPHEAFYLRACYRTGRSSNAGSGFSAGLGLRGRDLRLDYAFVPYGDLGDAHRVTIALSFGAARLSPAGKQSPKVVPQWSGAKNTTPATQQTNKKKSMGSEPVYFMW